MGSCGLIDGLNAVFFYVAAGVKARPVFDGESMKMFEEKCQKCGRILYGVTASQVEYNLLAHQGSKKCKRESA